MIYFEPLNLGWRPLFKSWLEAMPQSVVLEHKEFVEVLFEWILDPCLQFEKKNCKVSTLLFLFLAYFLIVLLNIQLFLMYLNLK